MSSQRVGVLVINFGEPAEPTIDAVQPYLKRIFLQNFDLEHHRAEEALARAEQLASDRAPRLVEDYRAIGGSPLNAQADAQADALQAVLAGRGLSVTAYSAFQFTPPTIGDRVREAMDDGIERLVILPVYPLCGRSTTVASLGRARSVAARLGWSVPVVGISGWHHVPEYVELRVDGIRAFVESRGLDLTSADTLLYFSVHGTPIKYLDEGNRYDRYVDEHTREIARRVGVGERFAVGFQNHTNRRIEWTRPDNEERIATLAERKLVVVPVAFMHEQSETLAELDHDLRAFVEASGKEYHRVPVPHDDPRFIEVLANLVERVIVHPPTAGDLLSACRCASLPNTWCSNGVRDLPPSPYGPSPGAPA